jgi:hypothetical protein
MLQRVNLACGPGGCGCGCNGSGMGASNATGHRRRYPKIEATLKSYIAQQLKDGRYFYINPSLNSSVIKNSAFGDAVVGDPVSTAVSTVASSVGDFLSGIWGAVAPTGFSTTQDANGVTGTWTSAADSPYWFVPGQGSSTPPTTPSVPANNPVSTLPAALQPQVTQAAANDLYGVPVSGWLIGGAAALLLVTLISSPRRRRR